MNIHCRRPCQAKQATPSLCLGPPVCYEKKLNWDESCEWAGDDPKATWAPPCSWRTQSQKYPLMMHFVALIASWPQAIIIEQQVNRGRHDASNSMKGFTCRSELERFLKISLIQQTWEQSTQRIPEVLYWEINMTESHLEYEHEHRMILKQVEDSNWKCWNWGHGLFLANAHKSFVVFLWSGSTYHHY